MNVVTRNAYELMRPLSAERFGNRTRQRLRMSPKRTGAFQSFARIVGKSNPPCGELIVVATAKSSFHATDVSLMIWSLALRRSS